MTHIDLKPDLFRRGGARPLATTALSLPYRVHIPDRRCIEARSVIVEEGEIGDEVFEIVEGVVMTSRLLDGQRRVVIDFRGPGQFVGLRHGRRALSTATSLTAVELQAVGGSGAVQPEADRLLCEIELAYRKIGTLARMNSHERVAEFLAGYAAASNSDIFELPMKRGEIADALGLTVESISRSLTEIRKAGLIRFIGGNPYHVEILDRDRIRRFGS